MAIIGDIVELDTVATRLHPREGETDAGYSISYRAMHAL